MRWRRATKDERAECVALYRDGAMLKHLAEKFGKHRVTINRWIAEAGAQRGHAFKNNWKQIASE